MKDSKQPPNGLRILFADDEESLQDLMSMELPRMGHRVTVCPDGESAVREARSESFDCLLVDLDMPGIHGIEVIRQVRELSPETEAVVMTGKESLETAVAAMRYGACDYLTKPCRLTDLQALLQRLLERRDNVREFYSNKKRIEKTSTGVQLIGEHASMQAVKRLVSKVAPTHSTVLIRGETGCGKELVARSVHDESPRASQAFVAINCGALPENLIESELFGHRKGAFTGADAQRVGLFEVASGGTIFLDEIGELPLGMQAKLLRVLESGEIRRVGDNDPFKVDVRVVCATHRDLEQMVEEGAFREDLMFRINTFEIHLPTLRERVSDIPNLAVHLFRRFRDDAVADAQIFSAEAMEELVNHVWPGNVRELANVIEHASILCEAPPILREHLPKHFTDRRLRKELRSLGPMSLKEMEFTVIQEAVTRHEGNKQAAAEELGISLKTLYNKLNQLASGSLSKSA
ncbi:sigma-54-dependent transcriptional regulator [Aureliella helgolandensis]|uniref:Transcriptional regulatory protein ZraR n=1 Tax=Aureliella helgolandensis TaxID=2527968 RepID=A0A518GGI5_9BACT|nr:sigma-54 dependent transcriptional regulator [Aureliella helgolandensis]QDV27711.1 Transcriptional regulatory protein ZraR [Aureliella helgolandensis]